MVGVCASVSIVSLTFAKESFAACTFSEANRRYLHLEKGTLYRVIGLAYLEDPECYASGSIATGRISLAGQDEGERSDEERYTGPPGWGLRHWTSTPTITKMFSS